MICVFKNFKVTKDRICKKSPSITKDGFQQNSSTQCYCVSGACVSSDGHQMSLAGNCTARFTASCVVATRGPPYTLKKMWDRHLWKHYFSETSLAGCKKVNCIMEDINSTVRGNVNWFFFHVTCKTLYDKLIVNAKQNTAKWLNKLGPCGLEFIWPCD